VSVLSLTTPVRIREIVEDVDFDWTGY